MVSAAPSASVTGSVTPYERHLFVASPTAPAEWNTTCSTASNSSPFELLQQKLKESKLSGTVKLTQFHLPEPLDSAPIGSHDVLLFPENLTFKLVTGLREVSGIISYLETGAHADVHPLHLPEDNIYFFVCCHAKRDERCGRCGPPVLNALKDAARACSRARAFGTVFVEGRANVKIHVLACSHVGGHQFAGNVLVYPPGDWYGYVDPQDAQPLLQHYVRLQHEHRIRREAVLCDTSDAARLLQIFPPLMGGVRCTWRGRVNLSKDATLAFGQASGPSCCTT